jgi:uncharacterized protein
VRCQRKPQVGTDAAVRCELAGETRRTHRSVTDSSSRTNPWGAHDAAEQTIEALQRGVDVIVQACLEVGHWVGFADVLRRVEKPTRLQPFSYEVWDTKLARDTRGSTILQLSAYWDLLSTIQGALPEHFYVVTPDPAHPIYEYRVDDYTAYYRLVRAQLEAAIEDGPDALRTRHYPEPVEPWQVCRWWIRCNDRRRQDDHLCFVADITRLHRRELEANGVTTLAAAAALPIPIPFRPARGSVVTYERIREQARLQVEHRNTGRPVYELLPIEPERGLCGLPAPSRGDVFLDLEGDPFARDGGREYLLGLGVRGGDDSFAYRCWWATTEAEECTAFEQVVDQISETWHRDPGMHVYHFGHYEVSAFKRLMGRYATREAESDALLLIRRSIDWPNRFASCPCRPDVKTKLPFGSSCAAPSAIMTTLTRFPMASSSDRESRPRHISHNGSIVGMCGLAF